MSKHHNVCRNDQIYVCESMCKTCIFRPGNLMDLKPGRVEDMVESAVSADSAIVCHSTLDGDNAVCRGFFDRHKADTLPLRLAVAFGGLAYQSIQEPGMSTKKSKKKNESVVAEVTPCSSPSTSLALWIRADKDAVSERRIGDVRCCDENRQLVRDKFGGSLLCIDTLGVEHWRLGRKPTAEELGKINWV